MPFHKVSTPGNLVKLRRFTQWSILTKWSNHNDDQNDAKSNDSEQIQLLEYWSVCNYIITKKIKKILLKKIKIASIIILPKRKSRYRYIGVFSRGFHNRNKHEFLSFPFSFGWFIWNSAETVRFHKIYTPGKVELQYCVQCYFFCIMHLSNCSSSLRISCFQFQKAHLKTKKSMTEGWKKVMSMGHIPKYNILVLM